jgi:aryl-alcohol dehydrogenase-like predicted oxidoreductase
MQSGILTDAFSAARVAAMAPDDWRRRAPEFNEPARSRNLALRDNLRAIAERRGSTVATIAVAWTLAWPGVTAAIVGARSPGQVDGWIDAARVTLTPDELAAITGALESSGAGSGPVSPAYSVLEAAPA